jgi:uncharacterized protein (DUF1501 family)
MSDFKLSRRNLLLGALATGATLSMAPFARRALAAPDGAARQRRFVFLYFPGGWDQLLFLDPRRFEYEATNDDAYKTRVQETGIDTRYRFATSDSLVDQYGQDLHIPDIDNADPTFWFGPAAAKLDSGTGAPAPLNLKALAEGSYNGDPAVPMSIVRGIDMATLGHQPGYLYFVTGEPSTGTAAEGASMPIRIASEFDSYTTHIPTVALSVSSFTGNKPGRFAALRAQNLSDLGDILLRPDKLRHSSAVEQALAAYASRTQGPKAQAYDSQGLLSALTGSSQGVRDMLEQDLGGQFDFLDPQAADPGGVRETYDINTDQPRSARASAAFVSQAVKTNLAQFISATIPAGGDSHGSGNRAHAEGLNRGIDAVARLVQDLNTSPAIGKNGDDLGGTWMDHTTICLFSEFGRTPLFNAMGGRDHHFSNSCLLIGAGIENGRVAGASSEVGGMIPVAHDFGSGIERPIKPEDIGATLLHSAGLDYGEYREALPLTHILTGGS